VGVNTVKTRFILAAGIALLLAAVFIFPGCEDIFNSAKDELPISGTVRIDPSQPFVGDTVIAKTQLDVPGAESYRWERSDAQNGPWTSIADSVSLILGEEYTDKYIRVTVKQAHRSGSLSSEAAIVRVRTPLTGTVSITGLALANRTLTANTDSLEGSGTISYQWERAATADAVDWMIMETNSKTYFIVPDDVGKYIRLTVTRAGNTGSVTSDATDAVIGAPLTGTVSISGTEAVGEILTAVINISENITISFHWECADTEDATEWIPIIGANHRQYTLEESDRGKYVRIVLISADKSGYLASRAVGPIDYPILRGSVHISETVAVGDIIMVDTDSLGGSGEISYQWNRITVANNKTSEEDIGEDLPEYTVVTGDTGKYISVTVTRSENTNSITSNRTDVITTSNLSGTVSIEGIFNIDSVLTANTSLLGGNKDWEITYQWERLGAKSSLFPFDYLYDIVGTNSPTYTPTSGDVGKNIRVTVSRTGYTGRKSSNVDKKDLVTNNLVGIVFITGDTAIGDTLTADISLLKGSGSITYMWNSDGKPVGGNTRTYPIAITDFEKSISVTVQRTGREGSVKSHPTEQVHKLPITGTVGISGTAAAGERLSAVTGGLDGNGTISYQWQVGDTVTGPWDDISGGIASTYTPVYTYEGKYICLTASRADREGSVSSEPTIAVFKRNLTGTVSISGNANVDSSLTAVTTSLGGTGDFIYQWERADDPSGPWTDIYDSNTKNYKLVWDDFDTFIRVTVARSDNLGSVSSNATTAAVDIPRLNGTLIIKGSAREGETLIADTSNIGSVTFTYQWQRSNYANGPWIDVGSNADTYPLTSADVNNFIQLTVSSASFQGSISSITARVVLPLLTGTVSISGTVQAGQTLTAVTGSLNGSGTLSYQWQRGDTASASAWLNVGSNSATYIPIALDAGKFIRVTVGLSDRSGSVSSSSTTAVTILPLTGTVSISGTPGTGYTLTANTSSLGGSGTISYQWQRSDSPSATAVWTNIGSGYNYVPSMADANKYIRVTVGRSYHTGSVTSSATSIITATPLTGSVTIIKSSDYARLSVDTSKLGGSGAISCKWEISELGLAFFPLSGGTSGSYNYNPAQILSVFRVTVSRANNSGSVTDTIYVGLW